MAFPGKSVIDYYTKEFSLCNNFYDFVINFDGWVWSIFIVIVVSEIHYMSYNR